MEQSNYLDTKATLFAIRAHGQQRRDLNGEPYVCHPIRVGNMAWKYVTHGNRTFVQTVGMFHDILEDTNVGVLAMFNQFGGRITDAVKCLTKPVGSLCADNFNGWSSREEKVEKSLDMYRTLDQREPDLAYYVRIVKLCDLYDNALSFHNDAKSLTDRDRAVRWAREQWRLLPLLKPSNNMLHDEVSMAVKMVEGLLL